MFYITLLILVLNYNLAIKAVVHILTGVFVIALYISYTLYILIVVLIAMPNNTLSNTKRIYKYINK